MFNPVLFTSSFFIWFGYYYKVSRFRLHTKYRIIFPSLLIITLGSVFWPGAAVNVSSRYHLLFVFTALVGVIAVFSISRWIHVTTHFLKLKTILNFVGNNTLTILTWHMSSFLLVSQFIIEIYKLPQARLAEFPVIVEYSKQGWWFAYFIVGTILPLGLAYINKWIKSSWLKL